MADIIKSWIVRRLNVAPDLTPEGLGQSVQSGYLLAKILQSYDVITMDQLNDVYRSSNYLANLKKLAIWLRFIGIECQLDLLYGLSLGKSSSALTILYEMYLALSDKDRGYNAIVNVDRQKNPPANTKFTIKKCKKPPEIRLETPLAKPLYANRKFIEMCRERDSNLQNHMRFLKQQMDPFYVKSCQDEVLQRGVVVTDFDLMTKMDRLNEDIAKFEKKHGHPPCCDYDELLKLQERAEQDVTNVPTEDPDAARKYVLSLRDKARRKESSKLLEKRIKSWIVEDFNKMVDEKDECTIAGTIASKIMKQSQYEKQMCSKVQQVAQFKSITEETEEKLAELARVTSEDSTRMLLELKRDKDYENENIKMEKERNWELHKVLYAAKIQMKHKMAVDICTDAVDALVDLASRRIEFREEHRIDVPEEMWGQWASLFVKCLPIFDILEHPEDMLDEIEEIVHLEVERQDTMNEHDFGDYMERIGVWKNEEIWSVDNDKEFFAEEFEGEEIPVMEVGNTREEIIVEPDLLLIGHVVHLLLDAKYPEPIPPPGADIPQVEYRSVLIGVDDSDVIKALAILLRFKKIAIIEPALVINHCVAKYREEGRIEDLTEEYEEPMQVPESLLQEIFEAEEKQRLADEDALRKAEAALKKGASSDKGKKGKKEKGKKEKGKKGEKGSKEEKSTKGDKSKKSKESKKSKKDSKESKKGSKGSKKGKSVASDEPECPTKSIETKETQTPIHIPEIVKLSPLAALGEMVYTDFLEGEPIPDELFVDMLMEYLRSLDGINGWVLLGYPQTTLQAHIFETVTTGKEPLIGLCLYDEMPEREIEKYINSKLVPNPHPRPTPPDYPTILTSYVSFMKERSTASLLEKICLFEPNQKVYDFYMSQGMFYDYYYNFFDVNTVKKMAKLIIGDFTLPLKLSEELIGLTVGDREPNPLIKEEEIEEEASLHLTEVLEECLAGEEEGIYEEGDATCKEIIIRDSNIFDIQIIQIPEEPRVYVSEPSIALESLVALATLWENIECTYLSEFPQLLFSRRRHFVAVPVYLTHMANHFTQFLTRPSTDQDSVYKFQKEYNDLSDDLRSDSEVKCEIHCRLADLYQMLINLCEARRDESLVERERVIGLNWAADEMTFMTNVYIAALQLEVDRAVDTLQMLSDYYVFVAQKIPLQTRLSKILLERMKQDPKCDQECSPTVARIRSCMKDIYLSEYPEEQETPMEKALMEAYLIAVAHVTQCEEKSKGNLKGDKVDEKDGKKKGKNGSKSGKSTKAESKKGGKASSAKGAKSSDKGAKSAKGAKSSAKGGKSTAKGSKKGSKGSLTEGKGKKGKKDLSEIMQYAEDPEGAMRKDLIVNEANEALDQELQRVTSRLQLIRARGVKDIRTEQKYMSNLYNKIYDMVMDKYAREKLAVSLLADVIAAAIEREEKIQPALLLDEGGFTVRSNMLMFPDEPPPTPPPKEEPCPVDGFKISQLRELMTIFLRVSPAGLMSERAFTFLLADMVTLIALDNTNILPYKWSGLKSNDVNALVTGIFGSVAGVSWRDFIIYNLEVEFPTEDEILRTRRKFRSCDPELRESVSRDDYSRIRLWFESPKDEVVNEEHFYGETMKNKITKKKLPKVTTIDDVSEEDLVEDDAVEEGVGEEEEADLSAEDRHVRNDLIKELLFSMFEIEPDVMSYTAFLLAFCKDYDPKIGLSKALALCLGQKICWEEEIGETYAIKMADIALKQRLERLDALDASKEQYDRAVNITVDICEGVFISELHDPNVILRPIVSDIFREATKEKYDYFEECEEELGMEEFGGESFREIPSFKRPYGIMAQTSSIMYPGIEPRNDEILHRICMSPVHFILSAAIPWAKTQPQLSSTRNLRQGLLKTFTDLERFEDGVYVHKMLDHEFIKELLQEIHSFTIVKPKCIVADLLGLTQTDKSLEEVTASVEI